MKKSEDEKLREFLDSHIPKGTKVYAPPGASGIQCHIAHEHFEALRDEENMLLAQLHWMRFTG